jgi:Tol biopolymer transport system component
VTIVRSLNRRVKSADEVSCYGDFQAGPHGRYPAFASAETGSYSVPMHRPCHAGKRRWRQRGRDRSVRGHVILAVMFVGVMFISLVAPGLGRATLPGRNGKLYFTLFTHRGTGSQIAWVDVDRPQRVHIVRWLIGAGNVGWSPDGRRVAYQTSLGLFVADASGAHRRRLTIAHLRKQIYDGDPSWSPDGRWIAFAHEVPMHPTIELIRPNGRGRHTLTRGEAPSWSRDGRQVVFQAGEVGATHIFTVRKDGSGRRQITASAGMSDSLPDWSPDGRRIVFVREAIGQAHVARVYVVTPRAPARAEPVTNGPTYDTTPVWSPDGRWIVFSRGRPFGNFRLYLVRPDRSGLRAVTSGAMNVQVPRWQSLPLARR